MVHKKTRSAKSPKKKAGKKTKAKKRTTKTKAKKAKKVEVTSKAMQALVLAEDEVNQSTKVLLKSLRESAGYYYAVYDVSVRQMSKNPTYKAIPYDTLEVWCTNDGWRELRASYRQEIRQKVQALITTEIAQKRVEQLQAMQADYDLLGEILQEKNLKPRSLEGVVNARTRLAGQMDEMRQGLLEQHMPAMVQSLGATPTDDSPLRPDMKPRLSDEEARAAATTIIRMRREGLRKSLRQAETKRKKKPPPKRKPPAQVIEAEL